ncbi:alpha/beta hydrolase [Fusibacter paucivorans]|uniref:Alpha/beta hydrolase n=1 Tax=Fusibacter paucivorans TaxID=76009 RepID=A0ABS5PSL6_9FIRM|nr:alpha/beta hydrolase [Fusibacter paucivorans]MBS7528148.1 alpha/beta hydrolase [Fusibacter paucivorans]
MPYLTFEGKKVYFEKHGEGEQTLMFLNGIMMSTASWQAFVDYFSKRYTLVLIDFFDQGKSEYLEGASYTQDLQVSLVAHAIEALSLQRVLLVGISYGGEVAMKVAARHGSALEGLVLANTTAYTDPQLKTIGDSWNYAASTRDGSIFFKATIPPIYSATFYEAKLDWLTAREKMFTENLTPAWYDGFTRLVDSAAKHNALEELAAITCPVLLIGADQDQITPLRCQRQLQSMLKDAKFAVIQGCGHASMYEKPTEFVALIDGFAQVMSTSFNIL